MKSMAIQHKTSGKAAPSVVMKSSGSLNTEDRLSCIATAAYYKAESRGFMPGHELDDWLDAEAQFTVYEER